MHYPQAVLHLSFATALVISGGQAASANGADTVKVRLGEPLAVNPGVFGVNNNNAVAEAPTHDPAYAALFRGLGATKARYIGGSSSSFWDWRTGKYIPESEITHIWPAKHGNWMLPLVAEVQTLPDGKLGPASYDAFGKAANVDVQWMVNLTTRAEDQANMIKFLKENAAEVKYVELDNETYFWGGEFGGGKQRSTNYIERVASFSPTVRELYPDARIGVVASENGVFVDEMHRSEEAFTAWNGVITQPEYRPHYDAFILHHYVMNAGTLDDVEGGEAEFGRAFLTCPQVTLEHAVDVLARDYGGVPMWITEFNVIGYYRIGNSNDEKPDGEITAADSWIASTAHSAWNAIYQAGFWVTAMQNPEAIEILNHHSVTNVSLGWGLGSPVSEAEADFTATGQLFAHLASLGAEAEEVLSIEFEGNRPLANAFGEAAAEALQGVAVRSDGKLSLVVINRDDQPIHITLPAASDANQLRVITYSTDKQNDQTARVQLESDTPVWAQGPMTPTTASHNLADTSRTLLPGFSLSILTID